MTRFAFAIENNVGNATYRENLATYAKGRPDVRAEFLPIEFVADDVWAKIPVLRNPALLTSARTAAALRGARRHDRLDAALIHSQSVALFSLPFMRAVPTVISTDATPANFDTLNAGYEAVTRSRAVEAMKLAWTKATFRGAARVLAWSEWVKRSFVEDYGVPEEKVVTLHPGLDIELWKPSPEPRPAGGPVRVLFVSGDFRRKGGDVVLRWLDKTPHRDDVEVHMVSKEPVPEGERIVPHYGLTANSPGIVRVTQSCDVFAFPTRADCSPWVLVEAQAAGLPGVSTDVAAIRELIRDGETGYVVPPADDAAFFDRLDDLVADATRRQEMALAARRWAEQKFDIRKAAAALFAVMAEMAAEGRR